MIDKNRVMDQVLPAARGLLLDQWTRETQRLETMIVELEKSAQATNGDLAAVHPDATLLDKVITWAHNSVETTTNYQPQAELEAWRSAFADELKSLDEVATFPLTLEELQRSPEDDFRQSGWKTRTRFAWSSADGARKFANLFRKLFKQEEKAAATYTRSFSLHRFLHLHIAIPVELIQIQSWKKRRALFDDLFDSAIDLVLQKEESSDSESAQPTWDHVRETIHEATASFQQYLDNELNQLPGKLEKQWMYAGTGAYPETRFRDEVLTQQTDQRSGEANKAHQDWSTYLRAVRDSATKDLELKLLQVRSANISQTTARKIGELVADETLPAMRAASTKIQQSLKVFSSEAGKDQDALRTLLRREGRSLLKELQKEHLPEMMDGVLASRADTHLERVQISIENFVVSLSPVHRLILNRDPDTRPRMRVEEVPLRELVEKDLVPDFRRRHAHLAEKADQALQEMLRQISETDQVVEFNLEAALNVLGKDKSEEKVQEARQAAIEGVERASRQVDDLIQLAENYVREIEQELADEVEEFATHVASLADNQQVVELKLRLARAAAEERFRETVQRIIQRILGALPGLVKLGRNSYNWFRKRYSKLRSISGLGDESAASREGIERFLRETESAIEALPTVYRRLFRLEPLMDERFFAGREKEMKRVEDQIDLWTGGHFSATAVVGEKGSGRTSLLNMIQQHALKGKQVRRFELDRTLRTEEALVEKLAGQLKLQDVTSLDELSEAMLELQPAVIIVEDLQNLFLRTVHGFKLLEKFLLLLTKTGRKHFWLVSCSRYSWNYLERVDQIDRYFNRVVVLGGFSHERLREILLKRHRVSGYRLQFDLPDSIEKSRRYKKLNSDVERREYLLEHFLERVNGIASGNVTVALFLWMRAVRPQPGGVLQVATDFRFDPSFLAGLPAEEVFSLAALVLHEGLAIEDHAAVFHQDVEKSRLMIRRLANRGFLEEMEQGFRVHPFLYRAVVQLLQSRNMLP